MASIQKASVEWNGNVHECFLDWEALLKIQEKYPDELETMNGFAGRHLKATMFIAKAAGLPDLLFKGTGAAPIGVIVKAINEALHLAYVGPGALKVDDDDDDGKETEAENFPSPSS